jgi:hypothetical protein
MIYFKRENKFTSQNGIFQIVGHRSPIREETAQNIEKCLFSNILRILVLSQNYMMHITFL